jgi:hypothetical protein
MLVAEPYQAQSRRACELICAYEANEITLHELEETMCDLASETIQAVGTMIGGWTVLSTSESRMIAARRLCCHLASLSRSRN